MLFGCCFLFRLAYIYDGVCLDEGLFGFGVLVNSNKMEYAPITTVHATDDDFVDFEKFITRQEVEKKGRDDGVFKVLGNFVQVFFFHNKMIHM